MRSGPAPTVVESTEAIVTVDGQAVPATSWSITRELGELGQPAVRAATGTVHLARAEGIASRRHGSPWRGAISRPRETVTIDTGAGPWRVFSGVVDGVSGRAGGGVDLDIVDRFAALNRPINILGLFRTMPPVTEGGTFRQIGLQAEYVVDRAMRFCGFYATPWTTLNTVLNAPLQTSCWPHSGTCMEAGTLTPSSFGQATYRPTPSGFFGAENLYAVYRTTAAISANGPFHIMAAVGSTHTGNGRVWLVFTGGNVVLEATATHVRARVAGTNIVSIPAPAGSYTAFGLVCRGNTIRVETNGGHSGSGTMPSGLTGTTREVRVSSDPDARLAGVQVGNPSDSVYDLYPIRQWRQNAVLRNWNNVMYLDVVPDIAQRPVIDILSEISRAQCVYLWMDEDDILHWEHADGIRSRSPVTALTATDSLLELVHQQASETTGVDVTVNAETPLVNRSAVSNILLYQGRGTSIDNDQDLEEVLGSDEVWILTDQEFVSPYIPGGGGALSAAARRGRGSITGGIVTQDDTPDLLVGGGSNAAAFLSNPLPGVWTLRVEAGALTSNQTLTLRIGDLDVIPASQRGAGLPIIRGRGRAQWVMTNADATTNTGGREVITHDGGKWLQLSGSGFNGPQSIANFLGSLLSEGWVSVDLKVIPDFRLQLSDVVRVTDPIWLGVSLTGVVTRITAAGQNGQHTMTLSLDLLSATATDVTLAEFDARWSGGTLANLDTRWSGQTLADLDADPLR